MIKLSKNRSLKKNFEPFQWNLKKPNIFRRSGQVLALLETNLKSKINIKKERFHYSDPNS